MRKKNAQSLKDIMEELVVEQNLDTRLNEMQLISIWPEVTGKVIGNYTTNLFVRNRVLYVSLSSSVVRSELQMHRKKLIELLNVKTGADVIDQIIFR